jgi:hypothetical protein
MKRAVFAVVCPPVPGCTAESGELTLTAAPHPLHANGRESSLSTVNGLAGNTPGATPTLTEGVTTTATVRSVWSFSAARAGDGLHFTAAAVGVVARP